MSNLTSIDLPIMNTYARFPISIKKGKGTKVWDAQETEYLDFTSGIATCNLGHVPDTVHAALQDQLTQIWHTSNLYHIEKQQQLASLLTENSCFDQVFFCNSGAEANEAAIKLVRAYTKGNQNSQTSIITFKQSFHGRTIATVSATGQEKIKSGFEPLLEGFTHLPYNDFDALNMIRKYKPAAVMLELLQGEGGVIPADPRWVEKLVSICRKQGTLIVADEVQTGMGRTGSLFLYEQYGFEPDIMTLAKGLGSGFPIGAMLAKAEVAYAFQPGSHGSTFGGNFLASTAGYATLKEMTTTDLLNAVKENSEFLMNELKKLASDHSFIKDVRGRGFLIGLEVEAEAVNIVKAALEEHLLILVAGPNVVRLLPPVNVSKEEILEFLTIFTKLLQRFKEE